METTEFKILLIDTNQETISVILGALKNEGFKVLISLNSREGISIAKSELPHLVLVDLLMPELDGIDICLELRKDEKLKNTLVVFYSEVAEDYSQIAAFNAGADDYIIKPTKIRVLISRLKALLKRHVLSSSYTIKKLNKGLSIDRERYLIFKENEEIILPRKEFELLALLYASPRKVFTRQEIAFKIWGFEIPSGNRTIDVHIRKLREKLGDKYIKTVKGVGYSLEV